MALGPVPEDVLGKVYATNFGGESFPLEWRDEEEKKLFWYFDGLHYPQPVTPLYADVNPVYASCAYMFQRFGIPFGKDWLARRQNGWLYAAVVPRDAREAQELGPYFGAVLPVYAANFLRWWEERYLPEIRRNEAFLDSFPLETASLLDLLVHLEDARDIEERHWRLHWILNMAQFAAFLDFKTAVSQALGDRGLELAGDILVSVRDRNWDALRALWELKEKVKATPALRAAFEAETGRAVLQRLQESAAGRAFLAEDVAAYQREYGYKALYTHEYRYRTWREDPAPIVESIKGYLATDYNVYADLAAVAERRQRAIDELFGLVQDEATRESLRAKLQLALNMAPLTPDHHFYFDQGTHARMRLIYLAIGDRLVQQGVLDDREDIFFLTYHEIRTIGVQPDLFDARARVAERRAEWEAAFTLRPPDWIGTASHWALYEQPYNGLWGYPERFERAQRQPQGAEVIQGLAGAPGVAEGTARRVVSEEEFDQVQPGDVLVCRMTNPAWVVLFTNVVAVVTDDGGVLSHPAVVAREFGIPAVVGTDDATWRIRSGDRVRVNGTTGVVEILSRGAGGDA